MAKSSKLRPHESAQQATEAQRRALIVWNWPISATTSTTGLELPYHHQLAGWTGRASVVLGAGTVQGVALDASGDLQDLRHYGTRPRRLRGVLLRGVRWPREQARGSAIERPDGPVSARRTTAPRRRTRRGDVRGPRLGDVVEDTTSITGLELPCHHQLGGCTSIFGVDLGAGASRGVVLDGSGDPRHTRHSW